MAAAGVTTVAAEPIGIITVAEFTTSMLATVATMATTIDVVMVAVDVGTVVAVAKMALTVTMAIIPIATRIGDYIVGQIGIAPIHPVNTPLLRTDTRPTPCSLTCTAVDISTAADKMGQ